ncbi:MAG TPA: HAD-IA family hydrolase [Patescibacteria group bacterium]|nr:HAD-IA family hydrolase [Patescibacteria group bacterium]
MIKAIIFDCFGVLTGDRWKEFVSTLPAEQKRPASELNRQLDSSEISNAVFLKEVSKLTNHSSEKISNFINAEMHKNTELLEYIASLKLKYKIGMLSNVSSNWIHSFLTKSELNLFDDIVLSFEVGMTKHDSRIFSLASERLGVQNSECAFTDDNDQYCQTAIQEGMKAIHYRDFIQMKQELEVLIKQ